MGSLFTLHFHLDLVSDRNFIMLPDQTNFCHTLDLAQRIASTNSPNNTFLMSHKMRLPYEQVIKKKFHQEGIIG